MANGSASEIAPGTEATSENRTEETPVDVYVRPDDPNEPKKLRILSIDGGGVRGIIPATILRHLEEELQKFDPAGVIRLADYFDLIVGTSTGGLITAVITTPTPPTDGLARTGPNAPPRPAAEIVDFYEEYAKKIFPPVKGCLCELWKWLREIFRPRYNPENLDQLLNDYCGQQRLSDARTKVIIPSFDIQHQRPVFFSSWEILGSGAQSLRRALVRDVCRATTAAPTYLPPVSFTVPQAAGAVAQNFDMIDGGIAVNNPTYLGITQALLDHNSATGDQWNFSNCFVLSLGTGQHETAYSATTAAKWGVKDWLRYHGDVPLLSFLQNASADMVDYNLCTLVDDHKSAYDIGHQSLNDDRIAESYRNYLRIQIKIPNNLSKLDDSKNLQSLKDLVSPKKLQQDGISRLTIQNGQFLISTPGVTIEQALHSFAKRLSNLRHWYHRPGQSSTGGGGGN